MPGAAGTLAVVVMPRYMLHNALMWSEWGVLWGCPPGQVPGAAGTLAVVVMPRYVLHNALDAPLQYRQQGTAAERELAAGGARPVRAFQAAHGLPGPLSVACMYFCRLQAAHGLPGPSLCHMHVFLQTSSLHRLPGPLSVTCMYFCRLQAAHGLPGPLPSHACISADFKLRMACRGLSLTNECFYH